MILNRWAAFSDKELRLIYLALAKEFSDKMHAQEMNDEIVIEANRRGNDRAEWILS